MDQQPPHANPSATRKLIDFARVVAKCSGQLIPFLEKGIQELRNRESPREPLPAMPRLRPRAFETDRYAWNYGRIAEYLSPEQTDSRHPGRLCGVFVVHGIGMHENAETAALLRSGFEDAIDAIAHWQQRNPPAHAQHDASVELTDLPPPLIIGGDWANYEDIQSTFPGDWKRFLERERQFFRGLWKQRTSLARALAWLFKMQIILLNPRNVRIIGAHYLLYAPLQIILPLVVIFSAIRTPRVFVRMLTDTRLYLEPTGIYERAIVQKIDYIVGAGFLQMLGLDWDFRPLADIEKLRASGESVELERVVWVAHSLGTVISYNVIADLLDKAIQLEANGDELQKKGVAIFRKSFKRFVTLGSPLDKIALLYGSEVLRKWPATTQQWLNNSLTDSAGEAQESPEWWVNFFSVFDPISGFLRHPMFTTVVPPDNRLSSWRVSSLIPGMAHSQYWTDAQRSLRFILGRTYGPAVLRDMPLRRYTRCERISRYVVAYIVWLPVILFILLILKDITLLAAYGLSDISAHIQSYLSR